MMAARAILAATMLLTLVAGSIPWPLPALAAGDVIFAVLFWRYYRATRI